MKVKYEIIENEYLSVKLDAEPDKGDAESVQRFIGKMLTYIASRNNKYDDSHGSDNEPLKFQCFIDKKDRSSLRVYPTVAIQQWCCLFRTTKWDLHAAQIDFEKMCKGYGAEIEGLPNLDHAGKEEQRHACGV